ncbi:hypothetical protein L596_020380 [Steinernema carpocapsae]|uniref:Uncharacterized protein n=1 Tax=Steinernema carpocapsae TaxID=34508 RepID=A0A4U5MTC9_STECR|nr:hypothetical protein L596_020380 [Steinernema carpocapsae]
MRRPEKAIFRFFEKAILLRLALDPVLDVASMAQVLIRHIVKLANSKKATRKKKLDDIMEGQMATLSEAQTPPSQYLRPKNRDKPDPDEALNLSLSAAKFTPKRNVYNRGIQGSQPNLTKLENVPESVPELVRTDFVPWCSKFFTQPILDKIYQGMGTTSGQLGMDAHSSSNLKDQRRTWNIPEPHPL